MVLARCAVQRGGGHRHVSSPALARLTFLSMMFFSTFQLLSAAACSRYSIFIWGGSGAESTQVWATRRCLKPCQASRCSSYDPCHPETFRPRLRPLKLVTARVHPPPPGPSTSASW